MTQNPFKIISTENTFDSKKNKNNPRIETEAKFERMWLQNPEQFNPSRNAMERERIARTWSLIQFAFPSLEEKKCVDLGCGYGTLSKRLAESGGIVTAIDISQNALKNLQGLNLELCQDYVPRTKLPDDHYDLVVCTELIGYLPHEEHRLFFSELARLVKEEGYVICSTPLDIDSEDALQRFVSLAETEFTIKKWSASYHLFYIRLVDLLESPERFKKAAKDAEYRQREIEKRISFYKSLFRFNSTSILGSFWGAIAFLIKPIIKKIEQNRTFLLLLEKISRSIKNEQGISHLMFIGKRRPLIEPTVDKVPIERKFRKQVWE